MPCLQIAAVRLRSSHCQTYCVCSLKPPSFARCASNDGGSSRELVSRVRWNSFACALAGVSGNAESARGISPRAAHRSGRDTLASSGSCHRTKTAAFRREMRALPVVSWPALNVGDLPPLLHGHYPASLLLQSSPPLPAASVLSASQVRCLCLFPWHRWTGSQVPYESPNESHASYTPDTAWPVGRSPPHSSWSSGATPVLMPSKAFRCVTRGSLTLISLIHT